jgi:hypothetical protein
MRRAELLETHVRRVTGNTRTGSTDGISSEDFFQFFTDAQLMLQRRILTRHSKAFKAETTWSADGLESRALPADIFGQSVISLEYSATGNAQDYRVLERRTHLERISTDGDPLFYVVEGSTLLLGPYPRTGTLRLTYNRQLPRVDKRRGTVSSHTKSTTALTALTLAGYTAADFALFDHLTVVDFNGTVKMRGIPYTSVNSGSGVVSIYASSYTFPSGSTMTNGEYFCLGEYASTHVSLPDFCEDFVLAYCAKRIFNRDSSTDAVDADQELQRMALEIAETWGASGEDVDQVTVLNQDDYLEY